MNSTSEPVSDTRWQRVFVDHPAQALRWLLILSLIAGAGVVLLEIRTDGAAVHPRGHPAVTSTLVDRDAFRESVQAIVLVTSEHGAPPIASLAGLRRLETIHRGIQALPAVDANRVRSAASLFDPESDAPIVSLARYFDDLPADAATFPAWFERLQTSPLLEGLFLAHDGEAAVLYAQAAESQDRDEFVTALDDWIASQQTPEHKLRLTGPVVAEVMLGRSVLRDLAGLIPIMVAAMGLLLFFSLGTFGGVVIPLAEVALVLVFTFGAMGYCGIPITLVTTILPVVLMAMSVTDEIHLLERYQGRLARGLPATSMQAGRAFRREAMLGAIRDVRRPVVLTSLTTSVGFLAFTTASMAPIRHFGVFSAFGIIVAMLATFSFVPALAGVLPQSFFTQRIRRDREIGGPLPAYERWVVRRPGAAAALALLLVAGTAPGISHLAVQDSWVGNFDPDSALASAEREFNAHFWGSYRLDVALQSREPRFFQHREGLRLLERVRAAALIAPHVGGVVSHLVPYGEVARAIGETGPVSDLPESTLRRVTALAWGGGDTAGLSETLVWGGESARARIFVKRADYARAKELMRYLDDVLPPLVAPSGVTYHLSGDLSVATAVVDSIVTNQLRSILWAGLGVLVLLVAAFRSARLAAVAMAPLLAALPLVFGAMGYSGVTLGIATSMFSALAIGVGVDFALHFLYAYRRTRVFGAAHQPALREAFATSGRAIRWNASVLSFGFLVLTFSHLKPNHSLGWLLCAAMIACYAMTLLLMPWLLRWNFRGKP